MIVKLTYFKPSGKYYLEAEFEIGAGYALYNIWMLVGLKQQQKTLPGLQGGSWDGPILINVPDHPHDHPHLLLSRET